MECLKSKKERRAGEVVGDYGEWRGDLYGVFVDIVVDFKHLMPWTFSVISLQAWNREMRTRWRFLAIVSPTIDFWQKRLNIIIMEPRSLEPFISGRVDVLR